MSKICRRKLVAVVAAAPLVIHPSSSTVASRSPNASLPDPVVGRVEAWIAERDAIDAMMEEWADLEVAVCAKFKSHSLSLTRACRSQAPEAQAMRLLDRKIKSGLRRLHRKARRIVMMRPTSAQGALAKVWLGMRIQGPYDWNDEYIYALMRDGCEQLSLMLTS
jgi:hypothetical protein